MSTISGTVSNGITLGQAGYTSPLRIKHSGTVSNSSGAAIYASGTYTNPSIVNEGTVIATGGFDAIELKDGGSIVNMAKDALIQGYTGIDISGAAGAVTNSGTIAGTSTYGGGVILEAGGSVQNSGLIQGGAGVVVYSYGYKFHVGGAVFVGGSPGSVSNSGTMVGTGYGSGVFLATGGSVDNAGLIRGGVYISSFPFNGGGVGAVTNSGTIGGVYASVFLGAGGSVGNTGFIQGFSGVYLGGGAGMVTNSGTIAGTDLAGVILAEGGTVVDAGTITGGTGTAISFGGTGGNLLVLENGYNLGGGVFVAGTANTLELLGAAGAVTVDFDKPGAGFTNFATVEFGASSNHKETLAITNTAVLPGIISGFTQLHDTVDLTQLAPKNAIATLNPAISWWSATAASRCRCSSMRARITPASAGSPAPTAAAAPMSRSFSRATPPSRRATRASSPPARPV